MSFTEEFNRLPLQDLLKESLQADNNQVNRVLEKDRLSLRDFAVLISPTASRQIELLGQRSQALTKRRFGNVIRLFAPLYLSNECINNCVYCGFSRDNPILRVTLSVEEVVEEALALKAQGFRNVLLVSGEHPKFVDNGYLTSCIKAVAQHFPAVSLEIGPMEIPEYRTMTTAGAEGLVVYQETYDRNIYARMHTSGPKKDFDWRLETPERAYAAGFRRLGIGALYGLSDWRLEALSLAAHTFYLLKHCWKAQITLSFPRLRPCAGQFEPLSHMTDLELVQLICGFRMLFPDIGLVLSTRERESLRNGLIPLGITLLSAGSHTEPGGYTGAGSKNLHLTEKGKIKELTASTMGTNQNKATSQFDIADERSPEVMADQIRRLGYEPVWKDWDQSLCESPV